MITLEQSVAKKVVLTLTERATLPSPFFLIVFESDQDPDRENLRLYSPDLATALQKERFNLFLITMDDAGSTEGGVDDAPISLPTGTYTYKVYESETQTTTIADTTGEILEEGLCVVSNPNEYNNTFNDIYA